MPAKLQAAVERQGRSCLVFPPNVADYLVTDTVRRETAFDLENQGITGSLLNAKIIEIIQNSPFQNHIYQKPTTLSGGEQQLLAITAALQQSHDFLIGQHCFDFVSTRNLELMHDHLKTCGKRMLEVTHHNGWGGAETRSVWRLNGERLETVPITRWAPLFADWQATIPSWRLVVEDVEKRYDESGFALQIPHLILDHVRCLGIFGDNGSGKSTLADCLTGIASHSGRVAVILPGVESPRLGYLVQHAETLTHGFTVHDTIQRFVSQGRLSGVMAERLEQWLRESSWYRALSDLDAGIGCRPVIVAALLAGDYDVVILDEPTYGLPIKAVAEFLVQAVKDIRAKPLVLISQDRNFLTLFCDTIIHLDDGAVYERVSGAHLHI
ncbi:MAG: ATP-binding cassette domain-containing protein [Candidatus Neomarinimicrobiota bacterium]